MISDKKIQQYLDIAIFWLYLVAMFHINKIQLQLSAVISMADGGWRMADGRRPKFRHINTPVCLMAPPWQASLHKLHMVVGKKNHHTILPWWRHGHYLTTLVECHFLLNQTVLFFFSRK